MQEMLNIEKKISVTVELNGKVIGHDTALLGQIYRIQATDGRQSFFPSLLREGQCGKRLSEICHCKVCVCLTCQGLRESNDLCGLHRVRCLFKHHLFPPDLSA